MPQHLYRSKRTAVGAISTSAPDDALADALPSSTDAATHDVPCSGLSMRSVTLFAPLLGSRSDGEEAVDGSGLSTSVGACGSPSRWLGAAEGGGAGVGEGLPPPDERDAREDHMLPRGVADIGEAALGSSTMLPIIRCFFEMARLRAEVVRVSGKRL